MKNSVKEVIICMLAKIAKANRFEALCEKLAVELPEAKELLEIKRDISDDQVDFITDMVFRLMGFPREEVGVFVKDYLLDEIWCSKKCLTPEEMFTYLEEELKNVKE